MYKAMVMSFDGSYKIEHPIFETIEEAWEYSDDMGSKWYFYPFSFVISESEKTIIDASDNLEWTINKRIKTISKIFKNHSEESYTLNMDPLTFILSIEENPQC